MNTSTVSADIVAALISLFLAISSAVGAYAVAWVRRHVSAQNLMVSQRIARVAVTAAQQMGDAAGWSAGAKLTSALQDVRLLGEQHGIKLSDDQWRSLVEAEYAQFKQFRVALNAPDDAPAVAPAPDPAPKPKATHRKPPPDPAAPAA